MKTPKGQKPNMFNNNIKKLSFIEKDPKTSRNTIPKTRIKNSLPEKNIERVKVLRILERIESAKTKEAKTEILKQLKSKLSPIEFEIIMEELKKLEQKRLIKEFIQNKKKD